MVAEYRALVSHIIPQDIARGAQHYAKMISERLEGRDHHELVTIFAGQTDNLQTDHTLGVPSGILRRLGFDPRALIRLHRRLNEIEPDVIVAHGGEALKYAALVRPRNSKLIYLRIGISTAKAANPMRRLVQSLLLKAPRVVVAVSASVRDEVVQRYGLDPDVVTLISNARDETVFTPGTSRGDSAEPPKLIFLGHLTPTKRPELYIDLVVKLREKGLLLTAHMVGDGPLLDKMKARGAAADVAVLGRRGDIPELLRCSDILVFTSRSEGEGMPGVLIEASLVGLPIVTTDVPGARDVVDDGVTGFVVPEDAIDQFVQRTEQLLSDPLLRTTMGLRSRVRALERFTFAATVRSWSNLIESLLDQPRPNQPLG